MRSVRVVAATLRRRESGPRPAALRADVRHDIRLALTNWPERHQLDCRPDRLFAQLRVEDQGQADQVAMDTHPIGPDRVDTTNRALADWMATDFKRPKYKHRQGKTIYAALECCARRARRLRAPSDSGSRCRPTLDRVAQPSRGVSSMRPQRRPSKVRASG